MAVAEQPDAEPGRDFEDPPVMPVMRGIDQESGAELVPTHSQALDVATRDLGRLVAAWLLGFSNPRTREAYANDLRDFTAWAWNLDLDPLGLARPHLDAYARQLEALGRAPATVARRLSALASFYSFLVDEEIRQASPAARVRRPRVDDESPTLGLDRDELVRFLDAAERSGPRDFALACLLALNGLRVSEACGADVSALGEERGHRVLWVIRKRGKRERAALAPRTIDALARHLGAREDGPLFVADDGSRLDRHDTARIVRRLARAAGIAKRISPHSLRHTFVTLALDANVPLTDVQDGAGHADARTTRRYDRARHRLERHPTYRLAAFLDQ